MTRRPHLLLTLLTDFVSTSCGRNQGLQSSLVRRPERPQARWCCALHQRNGADRHRCGDARMV